MSKLDHGVVLIRANIHDSKDDELRYLLRVFEGMQVSVYSLPDFNLFDFALVGALSDALVDNKIVKAMHSDGRTPRFDSYYAFNGKRYVSHGKMLDHAVRSNWEMTFAQIEADEPWKKDQNRFFGMLLLEGNPTRDGVLRAVRRDLGAALEEAKCATEYCLSHITTMGNIQKDADAWLDLQASPVLERCQCWVRFYFDGAAALDARQALAKIDKFHHDFKRKLGRPITTICFPALAQRSTSEMLSIKAECHAALVKRIPRDTANMLWFGFDRALAEDGMPDMPLPLGNFILSAKARIGKTNAAVAAIDAYLKWSSKSSAELQNSPGYDGFDVVFLNLKNEVVSNDTKRAPAAEHEHQTSNEFQILKAFAKRNETIAFEPVHVADLEEYFRAADPNRPFLVYTEPDGKTSVLSTLSQLVANAPRPGRGIFLVVDEAFSKFSADSKTEMIEAYNAIYNKWPAKGIRAMLIGQEVSVIEDEHPELKSLFKKSTLLIGSQDEDEGKALIRALVAGLDPDDLVTTESLDCAMPDAMNKVERKENIPYKMGPVIVRPSLYGISSCHPVPCHVRPPMIPPEEQKLDEIKWWTAPTKNEN